MVGRNTQDLRFHQKIVVDGALLAILPLLAITRIRFKLKACSNVGLHHISHVTLISLTFFYLLHSTLVEIKGALIELKQGNITAETVKAIVNSTNEDVNLKNGWLHVPSYFLLCCGRTDWCLPINANS